MNRPGFRRSNRQTGPGHRVGPSQLSGPGTRGGPSQGSGSGQRSVGTFGGSEASDPGFGGAPFSQAQILHLMKSEFGRARRHEYPLTCLLLAVDRLRAIEEVHGFEFAGEVRRSLARVVREQTREHDHLGLLSEDRLMVLLPHSDRDAGRIVAERIREIFDGTEFQLDVNRLSASVSIGIASCEDRDTLFFDTLVSQAEVALDWSVRDGGDQVQVFRRDRFVDLES